MATDKNGQTLAVDDLVTIAGRVTAVHDELSVRTIDVALDPPDPGSATQTTAVIVSGCQTVKV